MTIDIVARRHLFGDVQTELERRYRVHPANDLDDPGLDDIAPRIRGMVTGGHLGADAAWLARFPALEIIAINGVGFDALDLDGADAYVRAGRWLHGPMELGRKFSALRFGIFGLGRIGKAIARRLEGFGVEIAYCDLAPQAGVAYPFHATPRELAAAVDVLIVSAAASEATRRIIDADVLAALGPEGMLVNVARGSIVDEPALCRAIEAGTLGAAGLDVFADEPNVPAALVDSERVILSPHIASATTDTRRAMGELVIANLDAHFAGRELPTPVV